MTNKAGRKSGSGGVLVILLCGTSACERAAPPPDTPAGQAPADAPAAPPAVRVLTVAGGEVWFGDAREGQDSSGGRCVERTLEIRGPAGRRIVPLLYTLDTPTVVDDSTIRARLFTNCQPGPTYRVDLRTGLPVRKDP
ncbi:MAG TPA: hypothetical protein VFM14_07685 [Gemmatimonadales bacterium]|nr:hypothetical protein [Gemmatimonadales bacterium]